MKTAIITVVALVFAQQAALAQAPARAPGPQTRVPVVRRQEPPPALPGARAEPTTVTPADKSGVDMPPNEALFDAINRGDLATAKDSLNRGADLNARNVLGLTPLDLAIDLGRNQISFLLLSLRRQKASSLRLQSHLESFTAVAARPPAPAALPAPPRFAGNGGAPVPQAGFMGFDTNARR